MRKLSLKISLFELAICRNYFIIYIIVIGIFDEYGSYPIFGLRIDKYVIIIHILGIPIMIPLKPKVR